MNPFALLGLLYESHYWLENLMETRIKPVYSQITECLDEMQANWVSGGNRKGTLPSGLATVIGELNSQKTRWEAKFETDLSGLLPHSRRFFMEELSKWTAHFRTTAEYEEKRKMAEKQATRGGNPVAVGETGKGKVDVKRHKVETKDWMQLLKDHEKLAVQINQAVQATQQKLSNVKTYLAKGEEGLQAFHEIGALDKFASMGLALMAIMVTPVPGITEMWLGTSFYMFQQEDQVGAGH